MRRSLRLLLSVFVVVVVALGVPALAQTPEPAVTGTETVVPAAAAELVPGLDPALVGLPLAPKGAASLAHLQAAHEQLADLYSQAGELEERRIQLDLVLDALEVEEARHARELVEAETLLGRAAASAYKSAGSLSGIGVALDANDANELAHGLKLSTSTAERLSELTEVAKAARRRAGAATRSVADDIVTNVKRTDEVRADLERAQEQWDDALDAATGLAGRLVISGTDLPLVMLDAYVRASRAVAWLEPECRLSWWALAGVGKVESNHARHGGSRTDLLGNVDPPIIGIPLDGSPGIALIADTDGGWLDGDPFFDRAVGPMQFIPSTWSRWGHDGNGNEQIDPQNAYDATLSAGLYLCASAPSGGLVEDGALLGAYLSYNHSLEYAAKVLSLARSYQGALGELALP
jgi:membrane-bound lytic murein transglycosylase B